MFDIMITCEEAAQHVGDSNWIFIDCRFYLADKEQGAREYAQSHIKGAVYAHLDRDLAGTIITGKTGRHPLPHKEDFVATLSRLGVSNNSQVVVYDNQCGQLAAARLWWMLKWAGHQSVAVLDGGMQSWKKLNLPLESGEHKNPPGAFKPEFNDNLVLSATEIENILNNPKYALVDARSADRFRGENETVDPVAGHIPGALSFPHTDNVAPDGKLKNAFELKERFAKHLENIPESNTVFYCGSGVTATHDILAYIRSGRKMPRLYVGSWSDWITNPKHPIES